MATIVDVARRSGVAVSTVSNFINNKKYVSSDLGKKIEIAIKELNFEIDPVAQKMKARKSHTIGLITADLGGLFYPYVMKGVYEIADEKGYQVIVNDTNSGSGELSAIAKEKSCFKKLIQNKVDGIIFASVFAQKEALLYFNEIRSYLKDIYIPLVSVEQDFTMCGIDSVYTDGYQAAQMATKHLIECGCKHIVHIGGPYFTSIAKERVEGYLSVMRTASLDVDANNNIVYGNYSHQSGYRAMKLLLERVPNVDGVFSANDQMAIGALKALDEKKIKVPQEIKIIGYDDVFVSCLVEPPLSTIHIQKYRAGIEAARLLFDRIEAKDDETISPRKIQMESELVVRRSTVPDMMDDWILKDW